MAWFDGFTRHTTDINGQTVCYRTGGKAGAPVLVLLHGFPQTHVMWHRVAQLLQNDYWLVMPDLRGYGDASHALGLPDHSNYSKRSMASAMVQVMVVSEPFFCTVRTSLFVPPTATTANGRS